MFVGNKSSPYSKLTFFSLPFLQLNTEARINSILSNPKEKYLPIFLPNKRCQNKNKERNWQRMNSLFLLLCVCSQGSRRKRKLEGMSPIYHEIFKGIECSGKNSELWVGNPMHFIGKLRFVARLNRKCIVMTWRLNFWIDIDYTDDKRFLGK